MKVFLIVAGVLPVLALFYCFLLVTRTRRDAATPFMAHPYAHRGLHDATLPENSLSAFSAAVAQGYGIELDVQISADGEVMVFHDESLLRMTGRNASLYALTKAELDTLRLGESDEHIPTLREVLALVDGRVPLLVEIKSDHALTEVCQKTAAILDEYTGPFMVESFHPLALRWFRKNRPDVVRGQLSARLFVKGKRTPSMFVVQNLLLNFLGRPDFIAFDYHNKNRFSFAVCRLLYHPYTVAWTVCDGEALRASRRFDAVIFEHLTKEELARAGRLPIKETEKET